MFIKKLVSGLLVVVLALHIDCIESDLDGTKPEQVHLSLGSKLLFL